MKKIAILGGSFDPVSNAHIKIAEEISAKFNCEIMILPAHLAKWKEDIPASTEDRLNMLQLAFKDKKNVFIEDLEIKEETNSPNNTIDTIFKLIDKYPNTEFYYIIGTDQLLNLPRWSNIDELIKLVTFIVVDREGYEKDTELLELYDCINSGIKLKNINSTDIREGTSKETPKEVLDYIKKKGLYIDLKLKKSLTEHRFTHSVSVAKLAKEIAIANNIDPDKAYIAGLLHDCAKNIKYEKAVELMLEYAPEHINEDRGIYHQYIGPVIAHDEYNIEDKEILDAIRYHTTAHYPFAALDKIIYLADKADPLRGYDSSFYINKAKENIDLGFAYILLDNHDYVINKKGKEDTLDPVELLNEAKDYLEDYKINNLYKAIDDHMGFKIISYDISSINPIAKTSIVVSALSERQLVALANTIEDYFIENHFYYHHTEKGKNSGWVLVDCGDIIINIFKDDDRNKYNLDELYKDLPHKEYKGEN